MSLHIHSLHIYPVKSCGGIDLESSGISAAGLAYDRHWMIVGDGQFLTQRQLPAMALIRTSFVQSPLHGAALRLQAPDCDPIEVPLSGAQVQETLQPVRVWRDVVPARSESQAVADWLSRFLGLECRLYRIDVEGAQRVADRDWVERWMRAHPPWAASFQRLNAYGFADGYPVLVANQASLDELNGLLAAQGDRPVPMNRFRPNIVVAGDLPAYEEDHVVYMESAAVKLALVKPCARCPIPDVDQDTGQRHLEPGNALQRTRSRELGVIFGQNAIVAAPEGARLAVGDRVSAEFSF
jgi:uncharacterized protein YcbX